ncbi:hypothetical protein, partial [Escherichia coli]|uniref:hypothetical protein n=1 Tax=Escherichia coli TaxID=562 RepID=UPI001F4AE80B
HQVFDPGGHFNPAKIFPAATPPGELAARRRARLERRRQETGDRGQGTGDHAAALAAIVGDEHVAKGARGLTVRPGAI